MHWVFITQCKMQFMLLRAVTFPHGPHSPPMSASGGPVGGRGRREGLASNVSANEDANIPLAHVIKLFLN